MYVLSVHGGVDAASAHHLAVPGWRRPCWPIPRGVVSLLWLQSQSQSQSQCTGRRSNSKSCWCCVGTVEKSCNVSSVVASERGRGRATVLE